MGTIDSRRGTTVVIGLGNPLMGDDGVGIAALKHLQEHWRLAHDVDLVDGGTWGMNLLPMIEDAERLLLIDAIDVGAMPGTPISIARDELPRYFALKLSPHQIDLKEVLALAELRGTLPRETVAVGVQPGRFDRFDLTDVVHDAIPALARRAAGILRAWGHDCAELAPPGGSGRRIQDMSRKNEATHPEPAPPESRLFTA